MYEIPPICVFFFQFLHCGFGLWNFFIGPRSTSEGHAVPWAFTMLEYITTRSMIFGDDFLLKVPWQQANEFHHQLVIICGFSLARGNLQSQLLQIIKLYNYTLSRQQGSQMECPSPILLSFSECLKKLLHVVHVSILFTSLSVFVQFLLECPSKSWKCDISNCYTEHTSSHQIQIGHKPTIIFMVIAPAFIAIFCFLLI